MNHPTRSRLQRFGAGSIALAAAFAAHGEGTTCRDCHPAIVERYAAHPMSHTLGAASARVIAPMAGTRLRDPASGFEYSIDIDADGVALFERKDGPPGFADLERRRKIALWIGAGRQDRSLVLENAGRWYFAPVEWSTRAGLVLAPHQELSPHSRLDFPISSECLACHTDTPPRDAYPLNTAAKDAPEGIGCAGCHGDTTTHLESLGAPGTIASLSALPPTRQLDVCARCHLQGDARVVLVTDDHAPFAPGDDLFSRRAAFVDRRPGDDFGFVSQSDRLALSACMSGSGDALTCTTCHDPHTAATITTRAEYDQACAQCHQPDDCTRPPPAADARSGDSCTACHMRTSAPFDLRHVTVTDHWIQRRPAPPAEARTIRVHASKTADLVRFRWPSERDRASDPGERTRRHQEDAGALAMALTHLGHPDRALPLFSQALSGDLPESLASLPAFSFMHGRALEATRRPADAERAYRAALAIDDDHAESRVNLGLLLANRGSDEATGLLKDTAVRFPLADAPWRNLAVLHFQRRDAAGFEDAMRRAIERNPETPSVRFQFGMYFLQQGRFEEARDELLATAAIDPDRESLWSRLGIALFELGERERAKAAFQEALRLDPADEDAKTGLQRCR